MSTPEHGAAAAAGESYEKYSQGHLTAFQVWRSNGMSLAGLNETTLGYLTEDPNFISDVREERQRREKAATAAAAAPTSAPARPIAKSRLTAPAARLPSLTEADDLSTSEGLKEWAAKNPTAAVPMLVWERMVRANRERREVLAAQLARLEGLLILADQRIKNLEANNTTTRGAQWGGEHEPGRQYRSGEFVRRKDAIWLCTADTTTSPERGENWDLIMRGVQAVR
jgi:hypothetical protein